MADRQRLVFGLLGAGLAALVGAVVLMLPPGAGERSGPETRRSPGGKTETAVRLDGRRVTVLTNHPHARSAEALGKWFEAETGAVVRNLVLDYKEALRYTLEDAASPSPKLDVAMVWYVHLGALVEAGALVDLTDFIAENATYLQVDDFLPGLWDTYTLYHGRRWGIPYDGDTHILFYRPSILERHGLSPPETWDDYLHVARTITGAERENGIFGAAIMAPRIPIILISSFMNRLGGYGGRLLDEDGRPALTTPETVAALRDMVLQGRYALPTPLETDWEVSRDAFLGGRVAMVEQWTDFGLMAEDPSQSLIQGDWDAVRMPRGPEPGGRHAPALNAGYCLSISTGSRDPEAARAYMLFASRPDITLRLNLMVGGIDPVRKSVLRSREYRDFAPRISRAVQAALKEATPWPKIPQAPAMLMGLTDGIILALEGKERPEQALARVREQWETMIPR